MKKKGFTLVELLAVIAILGIISIIAIPNVIKTMNRSTLKVMENQEMQVSTAAELYVADYCNRKLNNDYICSSHYQLDNYLCLSEIQDADYIKTVLYKKNVCKGVIVFNNGKAKTYLYCDGYTTAGAPTIYTACTN